MFYTWLSKVNLPRHRPRRLGKSTLKSNIFFGLLLKKLNIICHVQISTWRFLITVSFEPRVFTVYQEKVIELLV